VSVLVAVCELAVSLSLLTELPTDIPIFAFAPELAAVARLVGVPGEFTVSESFTFRLFSAF
jgi:hypothetical protein